MSAPRRMGAGEEGESMDWLTWGQAATVATLLLMALGAKWLQDAPARRKQNADQVLAAVRSLNARGEQATSYRIVCEIESDFWKQMGHGTVHLALSDLVEQGRLVCTETLRTPLGEGDPPRRFAYSEPTAAPSTSTPPAPR